MMRQRIVLFAASCSLLVASATSAQDSCTQINTQTLPTIDEQRVREAWLDWYNDYRSEQGLELYTLDDSLNQTAGNWSYYSVKRGTIDHRRVWQGAYYDYGVIKKWFSNFGLTFPNVRGITFSENIGWNYFNCKEDDCTDELIDATRSTFDFFMSEKGKSYRPHYNSIVNKEFRKIGVGFALDSASKKYYVTVHFATDVTVEAPICKGE